MLLYVEDEVLIQEAVVTALTEAGYEVVTAEDVDRARTLIADHGADLRALVTDINLGDGPDGWVVAREAREKFPALAIVYVSAASEHQWASQGVPGSVMIAKPFAAAQLVVAVSTLLVASSPGG